MVFQLLVSILIRRPLTFIILVGEIGGQGGIKMASANNNQLISSQGPHFSPRSSAKTNDKSTYLRKNASIRISDVVTASVCSEKTCMKKLMMKMINIIIIIIIIIMNKSQKTMVFHGRQ